MKHYDVIVIGAGLSALMAVSKLQEEGIDYICLERQKKISINCGEATSLTRFQALVPHSHRFVEHMTSQIIFKLPGKDICLKRRIAHIDRLKLQAFLAHDKNISFGVSCQDIETKSDEVIVKTDKGPFHSKLVIVAAGFNVALQKRLGLEKRKRMFYSSYGYVVDAKIPDRDSIFFEPLSGSFGLFWLFPKNGSRVVLGVSCLGKDLDLRKELEVKMRSHLKSFRLVRDFGGMTPACAPLDKVFSERILFCGDFAGFVAASTGEGICYALESGKLAGIHASLAVKEGNFSNFHLLAYQAACDRSFGKELRKSLRIRQFAYVLYKIGLARLLLRKGGSILDYR